MKRDLIINFTPTGMIPTKDITPKVPVAAGEVVEQVLEVSEIGVNMVHLHAPEPKTGLPTYKKEVYAEITSGVRAKNKDLVISVSTSGRDFFEFEKRSEVLDLEGELKPDFASLTLSSLNFNKQASVNSPEMIQTLAIVAGGGVRVGLEDNIWYDETRTRLASNRDLVDRVLDIANAMGRQPLDQKTIRERLGLAW